MTTRQNAIQIFKAAVAAVQPLQLVPAHLYIEGGILHIADQAFLVKSLQNIYVIGAGKASAAMAKAVEDVLGGLITAGIVVTKYGHSILLQKISCLEAAHPVPDEQGVAATAETIQLLQRAGVNDLVICLISGGASSLWIDIPDGALIGEVQQTFELLLKSGATIDEINTVRKHLSAIKGGQLLGYAPWATWFSFIISDVPGNDMAVIASGPTVADASTFQDVKNILDKYALTHRLPMSILQHINDGLKGKVKETMKENNPVFKKVRNSIIGSNKIALEAAVAMAGRLGYPIAFMDDGLAGDAATVGRELMRCCQQYTGVLPACFLLGGETTVAVTGKGKGGRNQHLALSALLQLATQNDQQLPHQITFLSAGTDGTDGPTDAAGAIVDSATLAMAAEKKLDAVKYFNDNDAYHFFEQTGGLLITGPTQTNVMDLVVVIVYQD